MINSSDFHTKRKLFIGMSAIMLAAFLWSLDGTFIRPHLYALPASLVVFLEHALGFVILSPFLFIGWHRIKFLTTKDWAAVLWICIFGGVLGTVMITKAFFAAFAAETSFATVVILQKLQPVFALLLAGILIKERLPRRFYGWALVAIAAAYLLAFGNAGMSVRDIVFDNKAAVYALVAAFAFGSSTVFGKRLTNHLDFQSVTALRFGITAVLTFLLILMTDDLWSIQSVNAVQWQLLVLIVFSSGAVALFIYYFGLRRVPASSATIAELFWPVSAIALDYIINRNVLTPLQAGATVVLLIAIYYVAKTGTLKPKTFSALVVPGRGVGRTLGFATANLDKTDLDMEHGVYVVRVTVNEQTYRGLMHFGYRETFQLGPTLEVYLKDFAGNLYGVTVEVAVERKIRDTKQFKNPLELRERIRKDIEALG